MIKNNNKNIYLYFNFYLQFYFYLFINFLINIFIIIFNHLGIKAI